MMGGVANKHDVFFLKFLHFTYIDSLVDLAFVLFLFNYSAARPLSL